MQKILLPCNDPKTLENRALQYPFCQRRPGYFVVLIGVWLFWDYRVHEASGSLLSIMKGQSLTNHLVNILRKYLQKEISIKVLSEISTSIFLIYDCGVCRWKKDSFPMKLKLEWKSLKKKKENIEKDVMDLIETNNQINMTSENFLSSNISFKKHLNAKSFNIFWEYCSNCAKIGFCFGVCCKDDANVQG